MNANFGILPPLNEIVRDKALRKQKMAERSLKEIEQFIKEM
jgi:folate-dependent tRNA-U54 methylase TrmFO/GidA